MYKKRHGVVVSSRSEWHSVANNIAATLVSDVEWEVTKTLLSEYRVVVDCAKKTKKMIEVRARDLEISLEKNGNLPCRQGTDEDVQLCARSRQASLALVHQRSDALPVL